MRKFLCFALTTLTFVFVSCASAPVNMSGKEKVVLVHGYGRSPSVMKKIEERLISNGYQVYLIGYGSYGRDIEDIKQEFKNKVNESIYGVTDKVHFVGHSLGGLLIRDYLGEKGISNLGNVVMLGSPNQGTPVVESLKEKWYFSYAGGAALSLSSKGSDFLRSLPAPSYKLGVIAGTVAYGRNLSAFNEINDGVVSCSSAKVDGMSDFLVLPVNHSGLRSNERVLNEVVLFLKNQHFSESSKDCPEIVTKL